jgi:hypothetical protein
MRKGATQFIGAITDKFFAAPECCSCADGRGALRHELPLSCAVHGSLSRRRIANDRRSSSHREDRRADPDEAANFSEMNGVGFSAVQLDCKQKVPAGVHAPRRFSLFQLPMIKGQPASSFLFGTGLQLLWLRTGRAVAEPAQRRLFLCGSHATAQVFLGGTTAFRFQNR